MKFESNAEDRPTVIKKFLKESSKEDWIKLINKLTLEEFVDLPVSIKNASPEEVIKEISSLMIMHRVDKSHLEDAIITILYSLRGLQVDPYKLNIIINLLSIIRPALYTNSIRNLIIEKAFWGLEYQNRNIHYALINYYRSAIGVEDILVTKHLLRLVKENIDGNLYLVVLRYFKRFDGSEERLFEIFADLIDKTTENKQRSSMLIFIEEWRKSDSFEPLCRFIDAKLSLENKRVQILSFLELLNKLLNRIIVNSEDIYCLLALNLTEMNLNQKVNSEDIRFLESYCDIEKGFIRGIINLKNHINNYEEGYEALFKETESRKRNYENFTKKSRPSDFVRTSFRLYPVSPNSDFYRNVEAYEFSQMKKKEIVQEVALSNNF